ncbi:energy transducer TonB [Ponticaulis sp.]|uniref:energy transducer TonB n=1 Tax=Ponticaulis sp. TaxID=2020902 RepID=UPI000B6B3146|nr:energy transducer TonB [Ponticaulis sp.]MAJ08865.1 energy transducer TonB [Ponticaulis sp.]RPG17555.1 MAG: TonB family protein [Hyphomonadaceae bacterium TMED125]HBJ92032.1 energy transducer TonB [Hyphomonadaceae bacterium]|tara:strand:- start:8437 stop:9060 length:624 start_codon:yes stop_codon:yes gene_type:complete
MFSNPLVRIILGVPFAGAIVVALFILMGWLIEPKPIELGENEFRSLSRVTPQEEATEIRRTTRQNVQRIQTADQPPPPPRLSSSRSDVNLPTPQIQGAAPATVEIGNVSGFALDAVAVSDRDAQPIRPPVPSYPTRAAERGIEGTCDVRFDVDERGRPFNIEATCTDNVFVREAERAVSRVEFAPKIVRGQAVRRVNVVYPISFNLQ